MNRIEQLKVYDYVNKTEKDFMKIFQTMTPSKYSYTPVEIYLKHRLFQCTKMNENLLDFILKKIKLDIPTSILDDVSGSIDIEIDNTGIKLDVHWEQIEKWDNVRSISTQFTEDEFNTIVLCVPKFYIIDDKKFTMSFTDGPFTLRQILYNIIKFEEISRQAKSWFGGIDCHHTFFEGLRKLKTDKEGNPYYRTSWGS